MDIEMLKYQQNVENMLPKNESSVTASEPYAEEQAFFMQNEDLFDFEKFSKVLQKLGKDTLFTLKNGNQVHIVKGNKTVLITVGKKGGSKFSGSWSIINNYEEYGAEMQQLESVINSQ